MRLLAFVALALLFSCCNQDNKVGYVNLQKVFDEFEYKKELEKQLTSVKDQRKYLLDSMQAELEKLKRQLTERGDQELIRNFAKQRDFYLQKRGQWEEEENEIVRKYDEKIFKQINSYVKDYGKQNSFQLIYGATSAGNIMYADTTLDMTSDVVAFINNRYKGKQ